MPSVSPFRTAEQTAERQPESSGDRLLRLGMPRRRSRSRALRYPVLCRLSARRVPCRSNDVYDGPAAGRKPARPSMDTMQENRGKTCGPGKRH